MAKPVLKRTADALANALSGALTDLDAWASSGPEGMSAEERARFRSYERTLARYLARDDRKA